MRRPAPRAAILVAAVSLPALAMGTGNGERRTEAPIRSPFPVPRSHTADTLTSEFEVSGVRVILRRNTANDVVAANLYLLGGTRQVTAADAGMEVLLLGASERGTLRFPGDAARRTVDALGSTIVLEATEDWTMIGLRAVRATFDSTWMVLADRAAAPTLDSAGVELVRSQLLAGARAVRDAPDALVRYLADSAAFAGHPYALAPEGTERSLAAISLAALRRYHAEQVVTSRLLLVVVGNVERTRVERLVAATLGALPRGAYRWTPPADPGAPCAAGARPAGGSCEGRDRAARLAVAPRALPTNYILGRYVGPPASSRDYQALRVATTVLTGRLFAEIRSRRNLTYAVDAPFEERAIATGGLYVTTVSPDTTLALMRSEVERLKTELAEPASLARLVQGFLTEYFLDTETNAEQGDFLARAAVYRGDYRSADGFVDELRRVTPEDVRRVARRYMHDVSWAYVGDPAKLPRGRLARF